MSSLISRIKDAWLVLTGKGIISREYSKPLVMHGRLSKFRKVTLTHENHLVILNPGETPLRMMEFTTRDMRVFDTSMGSKIADFSLNDDGSMDRVLKYQLGEMCVTGAFVSETRELGVLFNKDEIASAVVFIELPEYQMVETA